VTTTHNERLTVPWLWWPAALAAAAVLAAPFGFGVLGMLGWTVAFALLGLPTVAGLWWLGRIRVAVAGDELLVDDARLPVRFVAAAIPLDAAGRRELLGTAADPLAFVVQRPWVAGAVQVLLDDPADPTPYWLVSTRHPERLAAALRTGSGTAGSGRPRRGGGQQVSGEVGA
jgi:hypothetical protein